MQFVGIVGCGNFAVFGDKDKKLFYISLTTGETIQTVQLNHTNLVQDRSNPDQCYTIEKDTIIK